MTDNNVTPPSPQEQPTEQPAAGASASDEHNQAKLAHLLNGFFPILGGLVIWLTGKDRSTFIDDQGKEATNFGFTLAIAIFAANIINWILSAIIPFFFVIGWLLPVGVWVFGIIQGFQAGNKAQTGERVRYKFNYTRFIK